MIKMTQNIYIQNTYTTFCVLLECGKTIMTNIFYTLVHFWTSVVHLFTRYSFDSITTFIKANNGQFQQYILYIVRTHSRLL